MSGATSAAGMDAGGGGRLSSPTRLAAWLGLAGLLAVLNYASRFASGKPPKDLLYHYSEAVGGFVQYAIILGVVLAIAWVGPLRDVLALRPPRSLREAFLVALAVLVGVYAVAAVLNPFLHPGREQGLTPDRWDPSRAGAFALNFVLLAVIAPIIEELTFRGLGYSLLERFGAIVAIFATGLVFGLVHGLVNGLPILVVFGIGLAWVRSRSGSVYPGMVVHAAFNSIALVLAVTT